MPITLSQLDDLGALPFDDIIDVRAPSEFAEDHIPGALNLPVLSDAERAKVGTIYVQEDRFLARKIGAALVARNAAKHIEGPLADRDGGWRPLLYCWRGGQRSGSFASILAQIGWRVDLVAGGYKSYRKLVVKALYEENLPHKVVLIAGGTGTGKTDLLAKLKSNGAQVIDLEGLANHRGSLFGATGSAQPSQKLFETRLAAVLGQVAPERPVFLEAESRKIGSIVIPPSLWTLMQQAPRIQLSANTQARARYLTDLYGALWQDKDVLIPQLALLRPFHARAQIEAWQALGAQGALEQLTAELIAAHYDPRYDRSAPSRIPDDRHELTKITDETLNRVAHAIIAKWDPRTA